MKRIIAIFALLALASCAEGPTATAVGLDPITKTALDGNWEVTSLQFYVCNEHSCEVITYPRAFYGCAITPVGYLSFMPEPGLHVAGTLVAEVFFTSSCKELTEQFKLLTLAYYSLYVDNGHLMMNFHSLDYGAQFYTVEVHSEGEGKLVLDFYDDGAYVFTVRAKYAGEPKECLYAKSPETMEDYGYCYMDWHCDVMIASCIDKDDCVYVIDAYERGYGSWNLGDKNECTALMVPEKPWMK